MIISLIVSTETPLINITVDINRTLIIRGLGDSNANNIYTIDVHNLNIVINQYVSTDFITIDNIPKIGNNLAGIVRPNNRKPILDIASPTLSSTPSKMVPP